MRKSRFTDSQIMGMIKQNENGVSAANCVRTGSHYINGEYGSFRYIA